MPTNVTPEYRKAEEAFRVAQAIDEKIERLEDMISLLPKHKGTDHLYADLKRRLSQLKKQLTSSGRKKGGGPSFEIFHEGAAQVVLIGPPNSGKSTILNALTHAHPEIGDYPYTTNQAHPGMVPFKDIQIQLIDTPPVTPDYMYPHLLGLVRGADAVLFVADLSEDNLIEDMENVFEAFSMRHVRFVSSRSLTDRDSILCTVIANKRDAPGAEDRLDLLREMLQVKLEIYPLSCAEEKDYLKLPEFLYHWLAIIRVYTKAPGKKVDIDHPYTVFEGNTVEDVCLLVHKDFYENLRYARLWRGNANPITISRNATVRDGDILELHL